MHWLEEIELIRKAEDIKKTAVSSESEIDKWATVLSFKERYSRTLACHKKESVIFCLLKTSLDLLG